MPKPFRIVFALFPELTQLDFTGPLEVFKWLPETRVIVASTAGGELTSDSGLRFAGLERLSHVDGCELLCVPGGFGLTAALGDRGYIAEVRRLGLTARYVTSVCSGSLVLAAAGLIEGKRAACHWAWRDLLAESGAIASDGRVVRDGNVITGGGVTAGIDFGLAVAAELAGEDFAHGIALAMEYDPQPPFETGSPLKSPPHVLAAVRERLMAAYADRKAALLAAREELGRAS